MSALVLLNQGIFLDSLNITSRSNAVALGLSSDPKVVTCFQDVTNKRIGGLFQVAAQVEGYINTDATDAALFADIGVNDKLLTFASEGEVVGNACHFFKAMLAQYTGKMSVGEAAMFSLTAEASGSRLVKGNILLNSKAVPITSTGVGTAVQLGALTAGKTLYMGVHVISGTGTMALKLTSDNSSGFASPADVLSFSSITAAGSQMLSTATPGTDDWYRFAYTISGSTPSFQAVAVVGIL